MTLILGIDPGHDGAAVLLDPDGRLACAWRWADRRERKGQPGYDLALLRAGGEPETIARGVSLRACGASILGTVGSGARIVCEGLFAGRNGASSMDLAESCGRLLGDAVPDWRPPWVVWARLLVSGRLCAETANPARAPWLKAQGVISRADLLSDDHVLDAACLAAWGRIQDRVARNATQTKAPRRGQDAPGPASNLNPRGTT